MQIQYILYLRIDRKGWRELLYEIIYFRKPRKAAPSEHPFWILSPFSSKKEPNHQN